MSTPHDATYRELFWREPKMKTYNVTGTQPNQNAYQNLFNTDKSKPGDKPAIPEYVPPVDTFTRSVDGAANPDEIKRLLSEMDHMANAVRTLVYSALNGTNGTGQGFWAQRASNFKLSEADRAKAQELISEDGFFGVKQTTDRIMSFAKALVGEGASEKQIETMRAAVQKGFDQVARMFGGFDKLPQVTKDTYDSIMKAFDAWLPAKVDLQAPLED